MRDNLKHFPINWMDGMKINKNHFIAQDNGWKDMLHDGLSLGLSPLRYGILPPSAAGENTFNIKTSFDNQNALRVAVLACNAVTPGGVRVMLPALSTGGQTENDHLPAATFPLSLTSNEAVWWIVLSVNPFERQPAGSPDLSESPPRFPNALPVYSLQVVSESQLVQYKNHPYSLVIGKVLINGNEIKVDDEYIPPCLSVNAHPDLLTLHAELDQYLATLELKCSQIVQKIYKKSQQNDISELVNFLCDRIMLFLAGTITSFRWTMAYEPPASLFSSIASLARVMKNSVDLRTGSGKEELMNYLCEWCELKQGELESMLSSMASMEYQHNDVNRNIQKVITFVQVTGRLFETLSKLEFIGKRRDSGIFVKEEAIGASSSSDASQQKARRRFFG